MTVPFVRVLEPSPPAETGLDVKAVQRALHHAGVLELGYVVGRYGEKTYNAVGRLERHHHKTVTRRYTPENHSLLSPDFDEYGSWLMAQAKKKQTLDPRMKIVHTANWYYQYRMKIGYSQARPISTIYYGIRPPSFPGHLDCSGFFITQYWLNGLLAKLGAGNQGGAGNTWSLSKQGRSVSLANASPGDAIFYDGPLGSHQHVSIVVGNDRVLSMGHYPMGLYPFDMSPGYLHISEARTYL